MAKMRVHEIAKQLDSTSKTIITKLQELGVDVKNHMSTVEDSDSEKLLKLYKTRQDDRRGDAARNQTRERQQNPEARENPRQGAQQDDKNRQHTETHAYSHEQAGDPGNRDVQRRDRDAQGQRRHGEGHPSQSGVMRQRDQAPRDQRDPSSRDLRDPSSRDLRDPSSREAGDQQGQQNAPRRERDFSQNTQHRDRGGSNFQHRDGQASQQSGQRRDNQQGGQRRDGQQGGQRRDGFGQQGNQRRGQGQQSSFREGDRKEGYRRETDSEGQRHEGQAPVSGERQFIRREGQQRQEGYQRREHTPQADGERRENPVQGDGVQQQGGYQRRDGQGGQQGGYQRRDGQGQQSGYQRRDGQGQQGGYPRRDGQGQQGGYQRRDGQGQQGGGYQRRDGQGQQGGYQRRDGQEQQGGYQRRDGQEQQGGYQRRDGQEQQGGYQRRDGQGQPGGYPRRDGQGQSGGFARRDGQGQSGGFARRDGQGQSGGFTRRDGQGQSGGYPRRDQASAGAGPRNGQASSGGFQRRDGASGGFAKKDDGKPGFQRRDSKPAFGKKDDKKVEQPSKDDRKQLFQKSEQMRIEKAKGKKDTNQKESKQFYDKSGVLRKTGPQKKSKDVKKIIPKKTEPDISLIKIPLVLTVKELAEELHRSGADVVKTLMNLGVMATVTAEIDFDTAVKVGEKFNVIVEEAVEVDPFEQAFSQTENAEGDMVERPPVVVVMGHVDHGKTSLLDAIRSARVTETEAGGITQHIGAYTVAINGKPITFLDTPGHEAFTAMRMRGAQVTDIAVLVVAADDGVMPQTVEAINHAKAAGVEIIVAVNKIDKPGANPDRVKQELTEHGILVEDWGGDTITVNVSALQRTNIDRLLEMIIIVSEMKELKANPNKPARGTIVEARLDKGRGAVATVLVQDGTLRVGDTVVAGACFGHIRAMMDDKGHKIKSAGPSIPAEILGLADVPTAGDTFYVAQNEKQARMLSDSVIAKGRVNMIKALPQKVSLDDLFNQIQAGNVKDLNIILKADVQGSLEAVRTSLEKLSNNEVRVQVIHGGVGAVTESDVMLASASNAIIIGFNVRPEATAKAMADAEKVDVRLYRIIYNAIEDITAAMKGMLDPVYKEKVMGRAEIRQLFKASGVGTIGGSYVTDGKIIRGTQIRIIRDGKVVYDGTLDTLRRFKDDAREVSSGYECGLLFSKFNDIKEGDIAEAYAMEEIPR